jgi:hypothetical protein
MKWIAEPAALKPRRFVIERDPLAGFFLSVFEGARCTHDYKESTLDIAMCQAEEDFGVPRNAWLRLVN